MAIQLGERSDDSGEMHDINVTPFIDVILVLLIIFMVAAPLSTVDIPVDLPAAATQPQPRTEKPVFVTLKSDLSLSIGEDAVSPDQVAVALGNVTKGNRNTRLFLRADKTVPYGELMALMDRLRSAGYLRVALVALEGKKASAP